MPAIKSCILGMPFLGHTSGAAIHLPVRIRRCDIVTSYSLRSAWTWRQRIHSRLKSWNALIGCKRCHG